MIRIIKIVHWTARACSRSKLSNWTKMSYLICKLVRDDFSKHFCNYITSILYLEIHAQHTSYVSVIHLCNFTTFFSSFSIKYNCQNKTSTVVCSTVRFFRENVASLLCSRRISRIFLKKPQDWIFS